MRKGWRMQECEIISDPSGCLHSSLSQESLSPSEYRCDPPSSDDVSRHKRMYREHMMCLYTIKLSKGVSLTYSEHNMSYGRKQKKYYTNTERVQRHKSYQRHWVMYHCIMVS